MSKRTLLAAFAALLTILGPVQTVFAQGATGAINGQVVNESGTGIAGVTITMSDERTGLTRTVTTGSNGNFRLNLPPGNYELSAVGSGYAATNIEQVAINLGTTAQLTLPLQSSTIEEIVTYGTVQELMPMSTGETGLNITLDEIEQLPVARSVEAVALLAPGTISGDVAFGDDKTLVSFGGASVAENVYYIDGLNVTNFRNGLGGSSVPFEFYDQFQIKTGGYGAEFGRSTGGVINAVTKRGSNEFEYGVVAYSEPELFGGESPNAFRSNGTMYDFNGENRQSSYTTDIYLSGPIIKDHLFFYVLYEPQNTTSEFTSLGDVNTMNEQEIKDSFYGGNLTWNITDNHSLSYTAFTDEREIKTTQYDYSLATLDRGDVVGESTEFRGGDNWIARYDGNIGDNLAISAMYGENEYNLTDQSTNDLECPLIVDVRSTATNTYPGCWITSTVQQGGDKREAYRFDVEWFIGDHTVRAGYDREDNSSIDATVYPGFNFNPSQTGGIYYRYEDWAPGFQLSNGGIVPAGPVNSSGEVETVRVRYIENGGSFETISSAWYIEDTWDINDSFTVSAGLRNETFENKNAEGASFIKIDNQWAPRLALQWSPGGTGEQRVTVNWGRYHLPIAANTNVRLSGAELDYQRYFLWDGGIDPTTGAPTSIGGEGIPTTQEIGTQLLTSDGTVPDTSAIIDSSLDPMFQDEWIIGYERDFGGNWVAGVRYIYRELSSTIDDILVDYGLEAIGWDGPIGSSNDCHYVLTNPGTDVTTFCENSAGALEQVTIPADALGFPEAERTYQAIEFTVDGNITDYWTLAGSYTWSKNEGNTEGYVKSDIGQDDAGITQDFDIPQLMDGAFGYLPNDRRHKVKLWSSLQASDSLVLGANLAMQSGRPINAFGIGHPDGTPDYGDTFYLTQPDGSYTFVPRGTAGRTDWIVQLDLAAIYSFNWADRADIELRAEVFNVFNGESAREVYEFAEITPSQYRLPTSYQRPRYLRLGASIRF
jgi:hypothetical protein